MNTSLIKATIKTALYKTRSLLAGNDAYVSGLLAVGYDTTATIAAVSDGSFGTAYSTPATLIGAAIQEIDFSNDGTLIYSSAYTSGYSSTSLQIYPFFANFGTLYSGGLTNASEFRAKINPPNTVVAYATESTSTPIRAFAFSKTTGYGTQYANPPTDDQFNGALSWHPSNTALAYGGSYTGASSSSFVFPWSDSTGFGTKVNTPDIFAGFPYFNAVGTAVAWVSNSDGPFLRVYPWTGSAFGTAYSSVTNIDSNTQQSKSVAFSSTNNTFVRGYSTSSPYVSAYPWSDASGVGTKYANPASAWVGFEVSAVAISPDTGTIACTSAYDFMGGEGVQAWNFIEGTGFGTKYPASTIFPFPQNASASYKN